jgi:adenosine deaminase
MDNKEKRLIEYVRHMPKIELHLHLEGALLPDTLFTLIQKYGGESGISGIEDVNRHFQYRDFAGFMTAWEWKNKFFRKAEDFEMSTYETLLRLHGENIVYLEAFFSPWDFEKNGINMQEITEATISGCRAAQAACGIRCSLIADINRECGADAGMKRIGEICAYRDQGVIGIGLGGNEQRYPAEEYETVFREAERRGLHRTVHAGEAVGASSVWAAIHALHAERIGHGVRAEEDPALIDELRSKRIPLEMCPTSNLLTGAVSSILEHPAKRFLDQGLLVTINSDDPTMFHCTLTGEFETLIREQGCSPADIKQLSMNAIDASFLDAAEKKQLRKEYELAWDEAGMSAS